MRLHTVILESERTAGLIFHDGKAAKLDASDRTANAAPGVRLRTVRIPRRIHRTFGKLYAQDFQCGNLKYGLWPAMLGKPVSYPNF